MNNLIPELKLFMVLLGSKAKGRNVEQHDYFFGVGSSLKQLLPQMKAFWPEAGASLHIDGWREVNSVGDYRVRVIERDQLLQNDTGKKLFFVNLGGYTEGKLEEQHYIVLSVQDGKMQALQHSKATEFFKKNTIKTVLAANAHIDEKYGIDVDDFYRVDDILHHDTKSKYAIEITQGTELQPDTLHLGYLKLDKL